MKYKYVAKNLSGQTVKGTVEESSQQAAARVVKEQNLMPLRLEEAGGGVGIASLVSFGRGVSTSELANLTRQLSTMVTAGLPLTDALNLLRIQSPPRLSKVVGAILADVQSGVALSVAMEKHPRVFSKVYVALVRAGEAAGIMEKILMRLADNTEKSREFKAKVIGALIYPIIVVVGMVVVMAVMVLVVIPKLSELYADFGAELPAATKLVIGVSDLTVKYWWAMGALAVAAGLGIRAYLLTEVGRVHFDRMIYRLPVAGPLAREVMLTELSRTLSLLVGAGVPVVEALTIVSGAVGNLVVQREVTKIARQIEKGFPLSISFSESESFPPLVGQMLAVGEETGKVDEVLAKLSTYYESESGEKIKGLTTAIEPLILIVLAVGVGFLMYAIIMPIYGITNQF